jgi:hypothetical protein
MGSRSASEGASAVREREVATLKRGLTTARSDDQLIEKPGYLRSASDCTRRGCTRLCISPAFTLTPGSF